MNTHHATQFALEPGYRFQSGIFVPVESAPSEPFDPDEDGHEQQSRSAFVPSPTAAVGGDPIAERLFALRGHRLERTSLRPTEIEDIIGQDDALRNIGAILSSSTPSHMILIGPAGVGKTTVAKIALEIAKANDSGVFADDVPFIIVDGATLMHDAGNRISGLSTQAIESFYSNVRDVNKQLGLHPNTPQIRFGPLAQAHMGILFIDEIGEMHPADQTALLTVLEEGIERIPRRALAGGWLNDARTPLWMSAFARDGIPASVVLIGATTRQPSEIDAALRSRCEVVQFRELDEDDRREIALRAAVKIGVAMSPEVASTIAASTTTGRDAARRVELAASAAKRRGHAQIDLQDVLGRGSVKKIGFRRN